MPVVQIASMPIYAYCSMLPMVECACGVLSVGESKTMHVNVIIFVVLNIFKLVVPRLPAEMRALP